MENKNKEVPTYVCDCGYAPSDEEISTGSCPICESPIRE